MFKVEPVFCEISTFDKTYSDSFNIDFKYFPFYDRKKKKYDYSQYNIQEGYLQTKISIAPDFKCFCTNTFQGGLCYHIIRILNDEYKLPKHIIYYLHMAELKTTLNDLIDSNSNPNIFLNRLEDVLFEKFKNDHGDCPICANHMYEKGKIAQLFKCSNCNNYVHSKCMSNWYNKKLVKPQLNQKVEKNGCPFCRQKLT